MPSDSRMLSPPFPSPDNAVLRVVVGNAIASVPNGEASVEEAILHAAVHGWYEGHIQGEDTCPGRDFRGVLPGAQQPQLSTSHHQECRSENSASPDHRIESPQKEPIGHCADRVELHSKRIFNPQAGSHEGAGQSR